MAGLDFLNWINNKIKGTGGDTFKEDLAVSESSGDYDAEYKSKKPFLVPNKSKKNRP